MENKQRLGASFRDPSGFLFTRQGVLYRQVNKIYAENYQRLIETGLYERLVLAGLLIPHEEVSEPPFDEALAYRVLRPVPLKFISYPYEWSFSQLKDAALETIAIQKTALQSNLSLKDSSAYNIQFKDGRPILIDSLSFEMYREGQPWVAYRQFCQHFLAPLALMSTRDVRLGQLLRVYIDGLPLDLAAALLPRRTLFDFGLLTHLHLHAVAQKRYAGQAVDKERVSQGMSKTSFLGIIDSLESTVRKLRWKPAGTEWGDYYAASAGHYSQQAFDHKREIVTNFIDRIRPHSVWDLGANVGEFSRIASERGIPTIAFDIDPAAVERNYLTVREKNETNLLPLLMDLTNPSSDLGWQNRERMSFLSRAPADAVLALALVHHLAIGNNVPLPDLADFFDRLGKWLVIEFVPKEDSQVQRLLATREDIFPGYEVNNFKAVFAERFEIIESTPIQDSPRTLYLMQARWQ
jgi:ribosomal protein L11 methylase PrmA